MRRQRSSGDVDLMMALVLFEMFADDPPPARDEPHEEPPADAVKQPKPRPRPT